jgi:hypothetical protein
MLKKNAWEWDEAVLLQLISLGVQENLELDYKQCESLQKSDGRKNEISKDVSAFANSAGGVIVYGMKENGHTPTGLDVGYDPSDISKEWLEQVINSRIQRRLEGVRINCVNLPKTSPGKVAYVVHIPQSDRAPHQAADKRFYKRFNFESVPMEEYEIRDVSHRSAGPDIDLDFAFRPGGVAVALEKAGSEYFAAVNLVAVVRNDAQTPGDHFVIHLYIDKRIRVGKLDSEVMRGRDTQSITHNDASYELDQFTILWDTKRGLPLFNGISAELPAEPLRISLPTNSNSVFLGYRIGAPRMKTKDELIAISIEKSTAKFVRARTSPPVKS